MVTVCDGVLVKVGVCVIDLVGVTVTVADGEGTGGYVTPNVITIDEPPEKTVNPEEDSVKADKLLTPSMINCSPKLSALNTVDPDMLFISKTT